MRIHRVDAFALRLPAATVAGVPAYSAALVHVTSSDGVHGWGETDTSAPEAVCALVAHLLRYSLEGCELEESAASLAAYWQRLTAEMRTQGHTGGLVFDALAAVDMALWDLAARHRGISVAALLAAGSDATVRRSLPALWCGPEETPALEAAWAAGFRHFKLHHTGTERELMVRLDTLLLRHPQGAATVVDARWRLDWATGPAFGTMLDQRGVLWLECPLDAHNPAWHGLLAGRIHTPIAIGQCYRTSSELEPFFQAGGLRVLEPEVGRCGLSEGMHMARMAASYCMAVAPRASLSVGPKLAAALELAAAIPDCSLVPYRQDALALAGRCLRTGSPAVEGGRYLTGDAAPGLGVELEDAAIATWLKSGA